MYFVDLPIKKCDFPYFFVCLPVPNVPYDGLAIMMTPRHRVGHANVWPAIFYWGWYFITNGFFNEQSYHEFQGLKRPQILLSQIMWLKQYTIPMTGNGKHTSPIYGGLGDGLWHCFNHIICKKKAGLKNRLIFRLNNSCDAPIPLFLLPPLPHVLPSNFHAFRWFGGTSV